jgi:predicted secreted protein
MSKKIKVALIIAFSIVILLALQINANSFRAKSTINSWVETAFQGSAAAVQENDQIKLLSPAQSNSSGPSSPDLVDKSRR